MTKLKQWHDFSLDTKQNGERICRGLELSPIRSPVGIRDVTEIGSRFVTMIYLVNECRRSRPSRPHLRQVVDTLFFWGNPERKIYLNPIFWYFKSSFSLRKSLSIFWNIVYVMSGLLWTLGKLGSYVLGYKLCYHSCFLVVLGQNLLCS